MQVIINQHGVKRELVGPFEICCGPSELWAIKQMVDKAYAEAGENCCPAYGWRKVFIEPEVESIPNTPPRPWHL